MYAAMSARAPVLGLLTAGVLTALTTAALTGLSTGMWTGVDSPLLTTGMADGSGLRAGARPKSANPQQSGQAAQTGVTS